jgi:hypothetical integral membrane protein (TIGR02206 family)
MTPEFNLFGPAHLAILTAIPLAAALLRRPVRRPDVRVALGLFLTMNELVWYSFMLYHEGLRFPEGLPLQLCNFALWLAVAAVFTLRPAIVETAYFIGVGGSTQALLTPDLWAPLASYPTAYFFVAHGMTVAIPLALFWSGQAQPRPGSMWRALAVLNGFALAVGLFNAAFGTNYMYLCRKPLSASALDFFGPWPFYILVGELAAVAVFWLLWLPVRGAGDQRAIRAAGAGSRGSSFTSR